MPASWRRISPPSRPARSRPMNWPSCKLSATTCTTRRSGSCNADMISTATAADGSAIQAITARAGVFNEEEVACVGALWEEYLAQGAEVCGYNFIVDVEGERVRGWACYGPRDLTSGVFDLYWIAVDPDARRGGVGRDLLTASEEATRRAGGRMLIAETSGTPPYEPTRRFYAGMGYRLEASIKDFYRPGDDLAIFIKRF